MSEKNQTVLALYPNRYGIGYAIFDSPNNLVEYGIGYIRPAINGKALKRVQEYIAYYKPDIILIRNTEKNSKTSKRTEKLINMICKEARLQNLDIHSLTRTQIKNVFIQFKAKTKYQISEKIIEWFPQLLSYQYPKRKEWMSENHNTGVFDAISLALTYYYLE